LTSAKARAVRKSIQPEKAGRLFDFFLLSQLEKINPKGRDQTCRLPFSASAKEVPLLFDGEFREGQKRIENKHEFQTKRKIEGLLENL
jgi:hypothetical protein